MTKGNNEGDTLLHHQVGKEPQGNHGDLEALGTEPHTKYGGPYQIGDRIVRIRLSLM